VSMWWIDHQLRLNGSQEQVERRLSWTRVKTNSQRIVVLGDMDRSQMSKFWTRETIQQFSKGFPLNWKQILADDAENTNLRRSQRKKRCVNYQESPQLPVTPQQKRSRMISRAKENEDPEAIQWSEELDERLKMAHMTTACTPSFWNKVAASVGHGFSAQDCADRFNGFFRSPALRKRKKRVGMYFVLLQEVELCLEEIVGVQPSESVQRKLMLFKYRQECVRPDDLFDKTPLKLKKNDVRDREILPNIPSRLLNARDYICSPQADRKSQRKLSNSPSFEEHFKKQLCVEAYIKRLNFR